jgi:hypothetical protein
MTQNELNRAVARATGESVRTIAELGFCLADPEAMEHDPGPRHGIGDDPEDKILDWDELEAGRNVPVVPGRRLHPVPV